MLEKPLLAIPVDRPSLRAYVFWLYFWFHMAIVAASFGLWLPFVLVWLLGLGRWWSHKYARTFEAELTNKRIRIAYGVFFRKVKSIPLDRITDVIESQGILERRLSIWRVALQTAGTGQAEGVFLAVREPQGVQEAVLSARNEYVEAQREGAGGAA